MPNKPEVSIRKNRPGKWRGYIGGIRVIEFEDTADKTAEEQAREWKLNPHKAPEMNKPQPRAEPKTITNCVIYVDYSAVSELFRTDTFTKELDEFRDVLNDSAFIHGVATHEAGHAIKFDLQGVKDLLVRGPRMYHDLNPRPADPPYPSSAANVEEGLNAPDVVPSTADGVRMMAERFVAGGVASQAVLDTPQAQLKKEIAGDVLNFEMMCDRAISMGFVKSINRPGLWKEAWDAVHIELRQKPHIKEAIIATAHVIEDAIYRWKGQPIPFRCVWP
jgi:hypothetical protein